MSCRWHWVVLLPVSYVLFVPGNGIISLTNPDEVFYAGTAKEMIEQGSWTTPYLFGQPQFEKPIMLYWLLRLSFAALGITPFAARLFPAVFAILGVLSVYALGRVLFGEPKKALLGALVQASSFLYIGLARTVFTDLVFTVFILLSLTAFFWGYAARSRRTFSILLFFVLAGCAVLTKGPLGLALPLLVVVAFLVVQKDGKYLSGLPLWSGLALFALVAVPWYALMFHRYGNAFVAEFFYNDHWRRFVEAEHAAADNWYHYLLVMVGGMFPWSAYVLLGLGWLIVRVLRRAREMPERFLGCWIGVVFVVFQAAHSKLPSYIMPLFPALSLLVAHFIDRIFRPPDLAWVRTAIVWMNGVLLSLLSIGIGIAVFLFRRKCVSPLLPLGVLVGVLVLVAVAYLAAARGRRSAAFAHFVLLLVPLSLVAALPAIAPDIERRLSSSAVSERLSAALRAEDGWIIATKKQLRGIRFYTGHAVAMATIYGRDFFSPHPVTYLGTRRQLRAFLAEHPVCYGVFDDRILAQCIEFTRTSYTCETLWTGIGCNLVRLRERMSVVSQERGNREN